MFARLVQTAGKTGIGVFCHLENSRYSGQTNDNTKAKFLLYEEFLDGAALNAAFGRVLRQQRKQARLTQEQLALTADLQRNFVSELERGQKQASVMTLFKLASALHVAPHEFVRLLLEAVDGDRKRIESGSGSTTAKNPDSR
ncbi:MAG: helix-turn-helix domain-containing protein [Candidatus Accumulibacter sp.]|jgi:DNA-binding XRE family transcriptional regulator|nr:helix-turn-helix domain-containing protein [Accumulibacter sp.]